MFNSLTIKIRLISVTLILSALLGWVGFQGLQSQKSTMQSLKTVYEDRVIPLKQLKVVADMYAVNIVDTAHKTRNGNIDWSQGIANIEDAKKQIQKNWLAYTSTFLIDEEKNLIAEAAPLMTKADAAIFRLEQIMKNQDAHELALFTIKELYPSIDPISTKISELTDVQLVVAKKEFAHSEQQYLQDRQNLTRLIPGGILLALLLGFFLYRAIKQPIDEAYGYFKQMSSGDLNVDIKIRRQDEMAKILEAALAMKSALQSEQLETQRASEEMARVLGGLATGDLNQRVEGQYKGEFDVIKRDINRVNSALADLISDMRHMSDQHDAGDIDVMIDCNKFHGAYKEMAAGVNAMVTGHIEVKKKAMACVKAFGEGNFDAPLEKFPGKKAFINNTVEQVRKNLQALIDDTNMLAQAAAEGHVSVRADANRHTGDFRKIVEGVNATLETIVEPVILVKNATESINNASKEIAIGSADLSQRTEEQARSLEETAASIEELASTVKQNAENSNRANKLADEATSIAKKGGDIVNNVIRSMDMINDSSRKIAEIISVMDGIAFQTNILALNAAVEAARAGEDGRSFNVVAGEVRILAQRSASAAQEIKQLISQSVKEIEDGVGQVQVAGETMHEIVSSVMRVNNIIQGITVASMEQSQGIDQINKAVSTMEEVTHHNAALVEETAAAAESLKEQAEILAQAVEHFNVEGKVHQTNAKQQNTVTPKALEASFSFQDAIKAHSRWKVRLIDFIKGKSKEQLDIATVSRDDKCDLGCWLYGQASKYAHFPEYSELKNAHANFHRGIGEIVLIAQQGKSDKAMLMLGGEFARQSNLTINAIEQLQSRVINASPTIEKQ